MAIHRLQAPDGSIIRIEAPDDANPEQILSFAQSNFTNKPPEGSFSKWGQGAVFETAQGALPVFDELGAAANAVLGPRVVPGETMSQAYDRGLANIRAAEKDYEKTYPGTKLAANLTGGLASGAMAYGAVPAAYAVANPIKTGMALGAAQGAASGFAGGEGDRRALDAGLGAGVGTAAGFLGGALSSRLDPQTEAMVSKADEMGIPLGIAHTTNSPLLKTAATATNRISVADNSAPSREAFAKALARQMGANSLDPADMAAAKNQITGTLNRINTSNTVPVNNELLWKLNQIEERAASTLDDTGDISKINRNIANILNRSEGGQLNGQLYQDMRTNLGADSVNNGSLGIMKGDIKRALDQSFNSGLTGDDAIANQLARKQYGAYKTIEPAVDGAGGVSIPQVVNRIKKSPGYATGSGGEMGDLARIGGAFMRPGLDSGTAANSAVLQGMGNIGMGGVGAGAGYVASGGDPYGAVGGAALGLGIGTGVNKALYSPLVRRLMQGAQPEIMSPALARALMQQGGGQ